MTWKLSILANASTWKDCHEKGRASLAESATGVHEHTRDVPLRQPCAYLVSFSTDWLVLLLGKRRGWADYERRAVEVVRIVHILLEVGGRHVRLGTEDGDDVGPAK